MTRRSSVTLRAGRENSLRRRHPWIFSGAIQSQKGEIEAGTFVDILSSSGAVVGVGHWGTKGIALRVLAFESVADEASVVRERVSDAVSVRDRLGLLKSPVTNGYRLVHGEGDGLPGLVVDIYGECAVVQCHSSGMWRLRSEIADAVRTRLPHISQLVYRRVEAHVDDGGEERPGEAESAVSNIQFKENGLTFSADLVGGQKTGFFLDQRESRDWMRSQSQDRRVLNAFCYSGAFSVYALAGGASEVVSVDASKAAIELCEANVTLNGFAGRHSSVVADCFDYLPSIPSTYDIIILDPPAFVKHQRALDRGLRGYENVNAIAFDRIKPGGIVATFSCSQLVSKEMFREVVARAAARSGRVARIVHHFHQAACHPINVYHPEGEYLKGFAVTVD